MSRFWDEEKQPLHQKIGGAVSYASKQKECSKECGDDLGGVAGRRLGSRGREAARRASSTPRRAAPVSSKITKTSWAKRTPTPPRSRLARSPSSVTSRTYGWSCTVASWKARLSEASDVRSTLERTTKESDARARRRQGFQEQEGPGRKAQSQRRRRQRSARQRGRPRQACSGRYGATRKKLVDDYDKAFDALKASLDQKGKEVELLSSGPASG